jgi:hypothetical protein
MVRDVLPVILQAEVAVSFEGLWLEGRLPPRSHWFPALQLGQLAPAATYLRAQQLRGVLLQQTRQYFAAHGVAVLAKPARSLVGLDGLGSLLDLPELLLPVGMTTATFADAQPVGSGGDGGGAGGEGGGRGAGMLGLPWPATQRDTDTGSSSSSSHDGSGGDEGVPRSWTQPEMNSLLALPGDDAAVVAVAAAFQSVTDFHLQRPPLAEQLARLGSSASG